MHLQPPLVAERRQPRFWRLRRLKPIGNSELVALTLAAVSSCLIAAATSGAQTPGPVSEPVASSQPSTPPASVGSLEDAASGEAGAASQPATPPPASSGAASQPTSGTAASSMPAATAAVAPVATSPAPAAMPTSTTDVPSPAAWRSEIRAADMTNRPGASETSSVLPKGALLLQTGLDYASSGLPVGNSFEETRSVVVPDVTLRFGVTDFLEVRAGAKYGVSADVTTGDVVGGLEGHRVGTHIALFDESTFFPAAALALNVDVPLATFRYEHIGGEARLALSKGLFDVLGLAANLAAGWNGVDATPFVAWTAAASGTLGPSITPFVEVFGDYAPLAGTAPTIWVDAGASWSVTDWVALDAAIGINAYGAGLSYFTSVGMSFLFPGHLFLYGGSQ